MKLFKYFVVSIMFTIFPAGSADFTTLEKKFVNYFEISDKRSSFVDNKGKKYPETIIENYKDIVLILYTHGSDIAWKRDECDKPPKVILNLHNTQTAGKAIKVFMACSGIKGLKMKEIGKLIKNMKKGGSIYDNVDTDGVKFTEKYKQLNKQKVILRIVDNFLEKGARNIVLVGHSAGGWTALNLSARFPKKITGAIAFNPAFADKVKNRKKYPFLEEIRKHEIKILKSNNRLNALVFSDEKDEFETPTSLSFLSELNDLKFIDFTNSSCHKGHEAVKESCFEPFVKENNYISDYLKKVVN